MGVVEETKQRKGEQGRNIRVVHEQVGAIPINLKGKDISKDFVGNDGVIVDAFLDTLGT